MHNLEFRSGVIKPIDCVKEGFALIKGDFWLLLAIWLVGGLIGGISLMIAAGAMTCGTFYCYLRRIDGYPVKFDDLWKGMQWFLPGLVLMLVIVVPMLVVYAIIYIPVVMAAVMGNKVSQDELLTILLSAFVIDAIFIFLMVCLHTLLMFAFPLLVDRNVGVVTAMTTSARAVLKNLGGVVGLLVVNFGLILAGELAFCIGIYLVVPVVIAGNVVAYRKVFPSLGLTPSSSGGSI